MPTFQPILNPASAKPHISSGVQDNSWNTLLGDATELGIKAHYVHESEKMMGKMQGDIQNYLGQNQEAASREEAYNQYMQEAVKTEDTLWDSAGTIPEHIGIGGLGGETVDQFPGSVAPNMITADDVDAVQRNMSQTLDKYISAQQQGRMTIDQLQTRIQATVKQAAALNPLIQDELIQQAAKYMDMTGASSYIKNALKEEERLAKREDDLYQQDLAWAKQYNITLSRPNWRQEAREQAVIAQNHTLTMNQIKEATERRTIGRQALSELVNNPKNRQTFIQGALGTIHQMYQHSSSTMKSANDVFSATNQEINKQIAYINSISAYLPSDERSSLQGEIKLLEDQRAIYKELIEMGPNKAVAESRLAILQATARLPNVPAHEAFDLNQKIAATLNFMAQATGELIPSSLGRDSTGKDISVMSLINPDTLVGMVRDLNRAVSPYDTAPSPALAKLSTPDGKVSVQVMSNLQSPQSNPDAVRMNSHSISQMLTHLATLKDPEQATQATDIFIKQMLDSSKAAGLTMGQLLDTPTYNKLNEHLGKLMGNFRQGTGRVDYDTNLNKFSYLNEDGSINPVASERADTLFKSLISLNGFKDEDTIDKWGSVIADTARKSQPGQAQTHNPIVSTADLLKALQNTAADYNKAILSGDKVGAEILMQKMQGLERELGDGIGQQSLEKEVIDSTIPTLSPEAKERLSIPQPAPQQSGISPEFARELRNPQPKQQVDVREQSRKILMDSVKVALDSTGFKSSPLLKKSSKEDAIESISYIEALHDIPGAGPAIEAALIAFGLTNAIPTLAKKLPRMFAGGKVVAPTSNISVAGGSSGASKAIAQGALNEAKQMKQEQIKELYQQYWKKEWIKQHIDLPKSDLEWSNAIAQANKWVETRIKNPPLKSMEKK